MRTDAAYSAAVAAGVIPKLEVVLEFADDQSPGSYRIDSDGIAVDGSYIAEDAVSSGVPVGQVIRRRAVIKLYNGDGRYDSREFKKARINIYLRYREGRNGVMHLGEYYSEQPKSYGDFITLEANSDSTDLDAPFEYEDWEKGLQIGYGSFVAQIAQRFGLDTRFAWNTIENLDALRIHIPEDQYTARELLEFAAQLSGANVFVDEAGREILLQRYVDASAAYSVEDWISLTADHKADTVTGAELERVIADAQGRKVITLLSVGSKAGIVIHAKNNPIMTNALHVNSMLTGANGADFCNMNCSIPFDPMIEFMDKVEITDSHGRTFRTHITNVIHNFNGTTDIQTAT